MNKLLISIFFIAFSAVTQAGVSTVSGAKITRIEFYGTQFTVHLDQPHSASGCGHPGQVVAASVDSEPGKTHYSALLAIWMAGKTVNMQITDDVCSGDRPTLINWSAE